MEAAGVDGSPRTELADVAIDLEDPIVDSAEDPIEKAHTFNVNSLGDIVPGGALCCVNCNNAFEFSSQDPGNPSKLRGIMVSNCPSPVLRATSGHHALIASSWTASELKDPAIESDVNEPPPPE